METLPSLAVGSYLTTTCCYFAALWSGRAQIGRIAHALLCVSLLLWLGVLGQGSSATVTQSAVAPYLWTCAWLLCGAYLLLLKRYGLEALGSFITAIATLMSVIALLSADGSSELAKGSWANQLLRVHIGLAFVGVTAFAFSSAVSAVYLLEARMLKSSPTETLRRKLPPLTLLDGLALKGVIIGFPIYTIALLLGSVHAVSGGIDTLQLNYFLAVFSWVVYGVVLQARLTAGWRGRRAALLTIVGLVGVFSVVFSYSFGAA